MQARMSTFSNYADLLGVEVDHSGAQLLPEMGGSYSYDHAEFLAELAYGPARDAVSVLTRENTEITVHALAKLVLEAEVTTARLSATTKLRPSLTQRTCRVCLGHRRGPNLRRWPAPNTCRCRR